MTKTIEQTISLLEMLPDKEQNLALAFVKTPCSCMGSGLYETDTNRTRKTESCRKWRIYQRKRY